MIKIMSVKSPHKTWKRNVCVPHITLLWGQICRSAPKPDRSEDLLKNSFSNIVKIQKVKLDTTSQEVNIGPEALLVSFFHFCKSYM